MVWIASLIGLIVIGFDKFSDFKHKSRASQTTSTLYLDEGEVHHLKSLPVLLKTHTNTFIYSTANTLLFMQEVAKCFMHSQDLKLIKMESGIESGRVLVI